MDPTYPLDSLEGKEKYWIKGKGGRQKLSLLSKTRKCILLKEAICSQIQIFKVWSFIKGIFGKARRNTKRRELWRMYLPRIGATITHLHFHMPHFLLFFPLYPLGLLHTHTHTYHLCLVRLKLLPPLTLIYMSFRVN